MHFTLALKTQSNFTYNSLETNSRDHQMKLKEKISEQDLERIKGAVKNAEDQISGEIVPVILERSGTYLSAHYKAAMLASSFAFVTMILLDRYVVHDANLAFF